VKRLAGDAIRDIADGQPEQEVALEVLRDGDSPGFLPKLDVHLDPDALVRIS
jgi:hypothetical protein